MSTWNPTLPLPDAEDEKEANALAQRKARVAHLTDELLAAAKPKTEPKKKSSKAWE